MPAGIAAVARSCYSFEVISIFHATASGDSFVVIPAYNPKRDYRENKRLALETNKQTKPVRIQTQVMPVHNRMKPSAR